MGRRGSYWAKPIHYRKKVVWREADAGVLNHAFILVEQRVVVEVPTE